MVGTTPSGGKDQAGHRRRLVLALLLALGIGLGAAGAAAGYYLAHTAAPVPVVTQRLVVEVQPTAPGPFLLYLPLPADRAGVPAPGLDLAAERGRASFAVVQTEHGAALAVRGEGPVRLVAEGPMPVRFSLDDTTAKYRQFRFWGFLDGRAAGPVLVKVEVREHNHTAGWEGHVDTGHSIVVQTALEPRGWQRMRATHLFDIAAGGGYQEDFPRVVLGALGAAAAGLYPPAGLLVLGAWRRRGEAHAPGPGRAGPGPRIFK